MKKLLKGLAGVNKYFSVIAILFLLIFSFELYCQDPEKNQVSLIDSVQRFQGIIPPVEFQYDLDEIFTNPISNKIPFDILYDDNQSTVWLRTELSLSNQYFQSGTEKFDNHFTSTLYKQYLKESEFNMVRYVLGAVQTSAVAYMAYRHIKKYGFWK